MIMIRKRLSVLAGVSILFLLALPQFSLAAAKETKAADLVSDNQPVNLNSTLYRELFTELKERHNFSENDLNRLFSNLTIDRKVLLLMDRQWGTPLPWYQYRQRFITPAIVKQGKIYLQQYQSLFTRIEQDFGVNREAVVAIWAVETRYGANCGKFNLFRSLNTLFAAYPRRSDFFRHELIEYLLLCRKNNLDPKTILGSYAGAFGQAQFMPSSYRKYAIDYDGDHRADLLNSKPDIFASIANYLKTFGWKLNMPTVIDIGPELLSAEMIAASLRGWQGRVPWQSIAKAQNRTIPPSPDNTPLAITCLQIKPAPAARRCVAGYPNFQAILHYNHSLKYATAVSELAATLAR